MTITIPKSALTEPSEDNDGEGIAPAVGDHVDLSNVVGMVQGEDGDNLVVAIKSVNGAPCGDYAEEAGEPNEAAMMAKMQSMDEPAA